MDDTRPGEAFRRALECLALGDLPGAESLCESVVNAAPGHFDALHLLGVIALNTGRAARAEHFFGRALTIRDDVAEAHSNRSVACLRMGAFANALAAAERALALRSDVAEFWCNYANVLAAVGRAKEAIAIYGQALVRRKDYAEALAGRASVQIALGRLDAALEDFDAALKIAPAYLEALCNRAHLRIARGEFADAAMDCVRASALMPWHQTALYNRAIAEAGRGRNDAAQRLLKRVLAVTPIHAGAWVALGTALLEAIRPIDAANAFWRALALEPVQSAALNNLGNAEMMLGRSAEAERAYDRAIQIAPDFADAVLNRGLCRLSRGDFSRGWADYEWRWRAQPQRYKKRDLREPQWTGEDPSGQKILLHAEQGFGDTIQFVRYAPLLVARGARVILEVQPALQRLIADSFPDIPVLFRGDALPPFDWQCPLFSLAFGFEKLNSAIPATVPYLRARQSLATQWRKRLPAREQPRIGLVWAGNPVHQNDAQRSIGLELLLSALPEHAVYVSLQKELRAGDSPRLESRDVVHFGEGLDDFADTAALASLMDLVICVDTSVAHLVGALGRPCWVLLPRIGTDWRWMEERQTSPWYPTIKLFRQRLPGDWTHALDDISAQLRADLQS